MTDVAYNEEARAMLTRVAASVLSEERMRDLMEEIWHITKGVQGEFTCRHCDARQKAIVQVKDYEKILKAVYETYDQCYGRPGTAEGEPAGVNIIVERQWPTYGS